MLLTVTSFSVDHASNTLWATMVVSVSKKFLSEGRDESKQGEPIQRRDGDLNGSDTNCYIPTYDWIEIQRYTRITTEIGDWVVEESEFGNGISRALGGEQDELGEEEGYCLIHFLVDAFPVSLPSSIYSNSQPKAHDDTAQFSPSGWRGWRT